MVLVASGVVLINIFSLDVMVACIMYNSVYRNVVTMCKIPTYAKIYNILSRVSPAQKISSLSDVVCCRVNL